MENRLGNVWVSARIRSRQKTFRPMHDRLLVATRVRVVTLDGFALARQACRLWHHAFLLASDLG